MWLSGCRFVLLVLGAVLLAILLPSSSRVAGEVFFWRPSVSWSNPAHWQSGEIPCHADGIHLPGSQQPWSVDIKQPIALRKLVIGENAGVQFGSPGTGIHFLRVAGGCEASDGSLRLGKKQVFTGARLRDWGCASNWLYHDGRVAERPPCHGDVAVFQQNSSIPWVHITKPLGVGQVIWQGRLLRNTDDWLSITKHQLVIARHARFNAECDSVSDCDCYTSTSGCEEGVKSDDDNTAHRPTEPAITTARPSSEPPTSASRTTSADEATEQTSQPSEQPVFAVTRNNTSTAHTADDVHIGASLPPTLVSIEERQDVFTSDFLESSYHTKVITDDKPASTSVVSADDLVRTDPSDSGNSALPAGGATADQDSGFSNTTLLLIVCVVASLLLSLVIAMFVIACYRRRNRDVKTETTSWSPSAKRSEVQVPESNSHEYATPGKALQHVDTVMLQASRKQIAEYSDPSICTQSAAYAAASCCHAVDAAPEEYDLSAAETGLTEHDGGPHTGRSSIVSSCRSSVPPPVPERRLSQVTPTAGSEGMFYSPLPGRRFATPEMSVRRFATPSDLPQSEWKRMVLSEFDSCDSLSAPLPPMQTACATAAVGGGGDSGYCGGGESITHAAVNTSNTNAIDVNSHTLDASQELYTCSKMRRSLSNCHGASSNSSVFVHAGKRSRPASISSEKELGSLARQHHQQQQPQHHSTILAL
eukprot:scpid75825/ scgid18107/ 